MGLLIVKKIVYKFYKINFIILILLLSSQAVYADYNSDIKTAKEVLEKYKVIDNATFKNTDVVTRQECVETIVKAIGSNEKTVESQENVHFEIGNFTKPNILTGSGFSTRTLFAGFHGIVSGEVNPDPNEGGKLRVFFYPDRAVTLKEVMAFMVRCLEKSKEGLDYTFKRAEELELINKSDSFYQNTDGTVNPDDFCILLYRFLHQKRYLYYRSAYDIRIHIDYSGEVTYLEHLDEQQNGEENNDFEDPGNDPLKLYRIINKKTFKNADIVTRNECVDTLMKAIGSTEYTVYDQHAINCDPVFDDKENISIRVNDVIVDGDEIIYPIESVPEEYKDTGRLTPDGTGREINLFYPSKAVTTKEVLTYMIRCLGKDKDKPDIAFIKAQGLELIGENDSFFENIDDDISPDDFCVLLRRFLNQKRYLYYSGEYDGQIKVDQEGSVTYLEFFKQREPELQKLPSVLDIDYYSARKDK